MDPNRIPDHPEPSGLEVQNAESLEALAEEIQNRESLEEMKLDVKVIKAAILGDLENPDVAGVLEQIRSNRKRITLHERIFIALATAGGALGSFFTEIFK